MIKISLKNLLSYSLLLLITLFILIAARLLLHIPSRSIITIDSFTKINFGAIEPTMLVIFDVDETLIQPQDAYLTDIEMRSFLAEIFTVKQLIKHHDIDMKRWKYLASIVIKTAKETLIEPEMLEAIKALQRRGVQVIACTLISTGLFGVIPNMEQWRYENLKSLGFQGSYDNVVIHLPSFKRKPVFYKGILATDLEKKGPVIGAFLDTMHLQPVSIVMVDDTLDNLNSVLRECTTRGIKFQGYWYKAAQTKPSNAPLFEFQINYLIHHEKFLSDQEAAAMMNGSF